MPLEFDATGKSVELTDSATGELVSQIGHVGEIRVRTQYCARGYWRDARLTSAAFVAGEDGQLIYRTGDLGQWTTSGVLIHLGRRDDQVKILGRRLNLALIEAAIQSHPDVDEAAVIHSPSQESSHLIAFCSGSSSLSPADVRSFVGQSLDAWQIPRIVMIDELPTLPDGKVNRTAMRNQTEQILDGELKDSCALQTPTERRLAQLWRQILSIESIGREHSFTDLGGDSLHGVELLTAIERTFGQRLGLSDLAQSPTLAQMAARLQDSCPSQNDNLEVWRQGRHPILVVGYARTAQILLEHLPAERGILLLKIPGLHDTSTSFPSISKSVRLYLDKLQGIGVERPSAIVGFSYGGLLAYALAHAFCRHGAAPAITLLIEPSTPIQKAIDRQASRGSGQPSPPRVFSTSARLSAWIRRLARWRNWMSVLRFGRLLLVRKLGQRQNSAQRFEDFRLVMRLNTRTYQAPQYHGQVLLAGSTQYLATTAHTWRRLVTGRLDLLPIGDDSEHHAYSGPEVAAIWTQSLFERLDAPQLPDPTSLSRVVPGPEGTAESDVVEIVKPTPTSIPTPSRKLAAGQDIAR